MSTPHSKHQLLASLTPKELASLTRIKHTNGPVKHPPTGPQRRAQGLSPSGGASGDGAPLGGKAARLGQILSMALLLLAVPLAQAQTSSGFEGFETQTLFIPPVSQAWYTYSQQGNGDNPDYVVGNQALTGSRSLFMDHTSTNVEDHDFPRFTRTDGGQFCSEDGFTASFAFRLDAFPSTSTYWGFLGAVNDLDNVGSTTNDGWAVMAISPTGAIATAVNNGNGGSGISDSDSTGYTIAVDTWYSASLAFNCTNDTLTLALFDATGVALAGASSDVSAFTDTMNHLDLGVGVGASGSLKTFHDYWVDDVQFVDSNEVAPADNWCSDPTQEDFGGDPNADFDYHYVDSVVTFDSTHVTQAGFSDGYVMEADQSGGNDPASMGKGWTGEVKTLEVWFRVDTATEGQNSDFRAVFSFDGAVPSSTSVGDTHTTGAFADTIGVRLNEEGNDWRLNLEFTSGGNGPFQLGGSFLGLNPNEPSGFIFRVDTRATNPYVSIMNTDRVAYLNESMDQSVSGFDLGAKIDNEIFSQWFVQEGGILTLNAFTYLDDNDVGEPWQSTCIFLAGGGSFTGGQGTIPGGNLDPDPDPDPDPGAGADDFSALLDSPYFWVLLWTLVVIALTVLISYLTDAGFPVIVYGIECFIVYLWGVLLAGPEAINPYPLVLVLALVIALAIARFR